MTPGQRFISLAAVLAASVALSACGDDDTGDPIPAGVADELLAQLDDFQEGLDAGDCTNVDPRIQNLRSQLGTLDERGVGSDVQDALLDGVTTLRTLANDKCNQPDEEVETTPTETTETETVETAPEPVETIPEPEPEPEPIPEPEPEPDEGDGEGQFEPDDGGVSPGEDLPPGQEKKLERGDG